jgi:hypothetical protein
MYLHVRVYAYKHGINQNQYIGNLVASLGAANGLPPQIRTLRWCPNPVNTTYINGQGGVCDMICTAGERHLKFWYVLIFINVHINEYKLKNMYLCIYISIYLIY